MGQLMIRQKFAPLFSAPIDIQEPEKALGTHFIEATDVDRFKRKADWRGVTLDDHLPTPTQKRLGITVPADDPAVFTAEAALSRIVIPDDLRARIETMLSEGSSITISDSGLGPETGDGTDFITVTRRSPGVTSFTLRPRFVNLMDDHHTSSTSRTPGVERMAAAISGEMRNRSVSSTSILALPPHP